ncbi:hypothetical protein ACN38_g7260 [Penicillium nordicum]|uniref:Uncharacterized protein n=1 Tax=Penicillium nordicum TaxID=229535 RepID=A0A0M9WEI8_9EURO|nr:hypothetical protein ACN38_g7260 [Penicillium nordicum]
MIDQITHVTCSSSTQSDSLLLAWKTNICQLVFKRQWSHTTTAKKSSGALLALAPVDNSPGFPAPTPAHTNRLPVEVPPGFLPSTSPVDNLPGPPADMIPARPS